MNWMSFETIVQLSIVQKPNYVYGAEKKQWLDSFEQENDKLQKGINLEEKKKL